MRSSIIVVVVLTTLSACSFGIRAPRSGLGPEVAPTCDTAEEGAGYVTADAAGAILTGVPAGFYLANAGDVSDGVHALGIMFTAAAVAYVGGIVSGSRAGARCTAARKRHVRWQVATSRREQDQIRALTVRVREAARNGDCAGARAPLAALREVGDGPNVYAVMADPAVAACLAAPTPSAVPPPIPPSSPDPVPPLSPPGAAPAITAP